MSNAKYKQREITIHKELAGVYEANNRYQFYRNYINYWHDEISRYMANSSIRILDCGCGTGDFLEYMDRRGIEVFGIDISMDMLSKHKKRFTGRKTLCLADAEYLPFTDASFDMVICKDLLHHLEKPLLTIKEINRVLKENGLLILCEPSDDSLLLKLPRKILYALSRRFSEIHKSFFSNELSELLEKNGFKVESKRYFGYIGLALCYLPEILPVMKYTGKFENATSKFLIKMDDIFSGIPILKKQAFEIMLKCQKL